MPNSRSSTFLFHATALPGLILALTIGSSFAQTAPAEASKDAVPMQTERLSDAAANRQGMPAFSTFLSEIPPTAMRLSKIVGTPVIGLDHRTIGKIDEVLLGPDGQAKAVVMDVGGFLGVGGKKVAMPFEAVLWNTGNVTRAPGPSASLSPSEASQPPAGGAERMPGAKVTNEALTASNSVPRSDVNSGSGPIATGSTQPATVAVVGSDGGPVQAMVRATKAELEAAPAFRFDGRPER
jgi:hypothetical protein